MYVFFEIWIEIFIKINTLNLPLNFMNGISPPITFHIERFSL